MKLIVMILGIILIASILLGVLVRNGGLITIIGIGIVVVIAVLVGASSGKKAK